MNEAPVILEEQAVHEDRILFVPKDAPTGPAHAGPVESVHVSPCAVMATKFGLIVSCPPEALTRALAAATAPETADGHS